MKHVTSTLLVMRYLAAQQYFFLEVSVARYRAVYRSLDPA